MAPSLEPYHDAPVDITNTIDSASVRKSLNHSDMTRDRELTSVGSSTGNRAAEAFIRPVPARLSGRLVSYGFNISESQFSLSIHATTTSDTSPTEIFVPLFHFPRDRMNVDISNGRWVYDDETQLLKWWHDEGAQSIKINGVRRFTQGFENDTYFDMFKNAGCELM